MKLSLLAALAMVMSAAAASSPVERESADPSPQIDSTPFEYAATAGGSSRFKGSAGVDSMLSGSRGKSVGVDGRANLRGLTPSRPHQLYGANKGELLCAVSEELCLFIGLVKRVLGAAPSTNPMDTPRYRLIGCSSAYGGESTRQGFEPQHIRAIDLTTDTIRWCRDCYLRYPLRYHRGACRRVRREAEAIGRFRQRVLTIICDHNGP